MDPKVSLYYKEKKLIELVQKHSIQEQYIESKPHVENLNLIKECFGLFNDLAETQVDFRTRTIGTCSQIKLPLQPAQDFYKLKTYLFDFSREAKNNMEIECSGIEESINDLVTLTLKYKDHLDIFKSLKKSCDFIVGNHLNHLVE